jgi:hypothetical protein
MKTPAMSAIAAALLGSALMLPLTAEAQNAAIPGIPGFLNPSTGVFTARPAQLSAATLQRSGTITVTVTAVLGSNIPASVPVTCGITIASVDSAATNSASGAGVVVRTGNGGTCKVSIPYIFEVASSTTPMSVSAGIFAFVSANPSLNYNASHSFTPFAVPNGSKALAVTLAM